MSFPKEDRCKFEPEIVDPESIQRLARETGFEVKKARQDSLRCSLLNALLQESITGAPSYNDLAAKLLSRYGILVSKQAIAAKFDLPFEIFLAAILEHSIMKKVT